MKFEIHFEFRASLRKFQDLNFWDATIADWGGERWSAASVWFGEQAEAIRWMDFFCALLLQCICIALLQCAGLSPGSYTVWSTNAKQFSAKKIWPQILKLDTF
jgi:hypothetical protein